MENTYRNFAHNDDVCDEEISLREFANRQIAAEKFILRAPDGF
jgi:hypothetical protein